MSMAHSAIFNGTDPTFVGSGYCGSGGGAGGWRPSSAPPACPPRPGRTRPSAATRPTARPAPASCGRNAKCRCTYRGSSTSLFPHVCSSCRCGLCRACLRRPRWHRTRARSRSAPHARAQPGWLTEVAHILDNLGEGVGQEDARSVPPFVAISVENGSGHSCRSPSRGGVHNDRFCHRRRPCHAANLTAKLECQSHCQLLKYQQPRPSDF